MPNWVKHNTPPRALPKNWKAIRRSVLRRDDHQCCAVTIRGRCPEPATDVDHIVRGDNHDPSNLQSLCAEHHKIKTQMEAQAAKRSRKREREQHPGYL